MATPSYTRTLLQAISALTLGFYFTLSHAANYEHSNYRGDYYAGLGGNHTQLLIGNAEFNPTVLRLRAGAFVLKNIALELQFGHGIDSDSPFHSFDIEIDQLQAIYSRFQSPTQNGFRIYLLAGYARTQLLQTDQSGKNLINNSRTQSSFSGASYSIGIEDQLIYFKPVHFYLEANKLFNKDFDINSANLGIRYAF